MTSPRGCSSSGIYISLACDQWPTDFLSCLAHLPTVSWEITLNDLEEKAVDEFSSSGFKCPTRFEVKERECIPVLRWCSSDKIKCIEFSGIIDTGAFLD